MLRIIFAVSLLVNVAAFSQQTAKPLTKRIIVKTNVLSFVARRPTLSVEKMFTGTYSVEVSFVQGQFNHFLFTDHYDYKGLLIRVKKHFIPVEPGIICPYAAVYAGNLQRNIQTKGQTDNSGWFSYPSRRFSANSIRGGGSFGLCYFAKSRWVVDAQSGLGYGRYLHLNKADPDTYAYGYVDAQVWLSLGYCF